MTDGNKLPTLKERANASRTGLRAMLIYGKKHIQPIVLETPEEVTQRQDVLLTLHACAYSLAIGLSDSNYPYAFRAHATLVRSLYELFIDFYVIFSDESGSLARRAVAHAEVQRWNEARRLQTERARLALPRDPSVDRYLKDEHNRREVEKAVEEFWPEPGFSAVQKIPRDKWDGRSLSERVQYIGDKHGRREPFVLFHVDLYREWNWSAHATLAGVAGMAADHFDLTACKALHYGFNFFSEMTRLLVQDLRLAQPVLDEGSAIQEEWAGTAGVMPPDDGDPLQKAAVPR